jgi:hypothetical protein
MTSVRGRVIQVEWAAVCAADLRISVGLIMGTELMLPAGSARASRARAFAAR